MPERKDWLADIQQALTFGLNWVEAEIADEGTPPGPEPGPGAGEQAVMADTFVRKICLNTHANWRSGIWGQPQWKPLFIDTRIRYTRFKLGVSKPALQDLKDINAKVIALIEENYDKTKGQSYLDFAAANADWVMALEGPNEPNNGHPANWDTKLKDWCQWLWTQANIPQQLKGKPVVGPSVWKRIKADYQKLGDMSDVMDIGNLHYYTGGMRPTVTSQGDDSDSAGTLDEAIADAHIISPDLPLWITEEGWPISGAGCPAGPGFVTPLAQAKYTLRALCENYNRDVKITAIYSLLDDDQRDPPRYHGLCTATYQPRPAYHALKNCVKLFDDPGADFTPGKLDFTITGKDFEHLPLMQKRDGTFLITLWQDVESYKRTSPFGDLTPPTKQATLEFASPISVREFHPTRDAGPLREDAAVNHLIIDVPDELVVLEITP